ncbi:GNAT family N-acetyltransferase [Gulosibacter molinativorax]|uniref:N-acetyltransferase n=1 Tax=Gulosibacter molinativorax TaxID=256821 RepID=A0ABT7C443_9MICO|nr:GNAT family N-acetyltransferase [Gulosibacter molinativorax]MDJ1369993.1 N-acetyltransferase [Gulosibacter molinativorax]QUY63817.1 Histone acetyltransferase HPA2 [Gulosibacter molinativorax]
MTSLRLAPLTADNIVAANALSLKPGQENFVAPVSHSIAEAYVNQDTMWPRVVVDGDDVVAFIMATFNDESDDPLYRATILRMNVDAEHQRQGIGAFAVDAVLTEALERGFNEVVAVWEEGELGPGKFFQAMGFKIVGETPYGEVIGERSLRA